MRFFNTAGPCDPRFHYMLPAAERLPEAPEIVGMGGYFVVHAPRQTGKTTTLAALARALTAQGRYAALRFSCEAGEAAGDDYGAAQRAILQSIRRWARNELPSELLPPDPWPQSDDIGLLSEALHTWARACPRPLVLFFDEIDALRGQGLISVLRQLRDIYAMRPEGAPWSVALCGLRDVRDYKAASGGDPGRLGSASPFNIKLESLRLGDFTRDEVAALYAQHTNETGQPFTDEAVARAFASTGGQPWLVNALAREIVTKMRVGPPEPITAEHVEAARERLILARATHLDSLVDKLRQPRVRAVIEPLMAGTTIPATAYDDDVSYVRDLGLIAPGRMVEIANPIYREVIARVLTESVEQHVQLGSRPFTRPDGRLDMDALLHAFAEFWREHGEVLTGGLTYHEVAPQLVLMAFLQRIVNGGGFIDREYGLGRHRIDILVRWPHGDESGQRRWQREALELKVRRDKKRDPTEKGLAQLGEYLGRLGLDHGTLVIFDRRPGAPPIDERIAFEDARTPEGHAVTILRA
jgi:hypothetical protein